jgi:hypothetical protein
LLLQSQQNKNDEAKKAQEKADEEAARLAEEADLKKTLNTLDGDKVENLTNRELLNVVAEAIDTSSNARSEQFDNLMNDKFNKITSRLDITQQAIMRVATSMDVTTVKANNADFDDYQQDAGVIMQENPSMSVQRAYTLAKAERAAKAPGKQNTERERPGTTVTRSSSDRADEIAERRSTQKRSQSEANEQNQRRRSGVTSIRGIIDAGIDRTLAARD